MEPLKAVLLMSLCLVLVGVAAMPTASAVRCTDVVNEPVQCVDDVVDAVFCALDDETDPDCPN